jgi:hypothetical protein
MKIFRKGLELYIKSSIHVAFSVYSLVQITWFMFSIPHNKPLLHFSFFGTIVGYNFVKYIPLILSQKCTFQNSVKRIIWISIISILAASYSFFQLQKLTQIVAICIFILVLLYTLPFFPNRQNTRNWAGIKIYIVALCWVGVTLVLPIVEAKIALSSYFYWNCLHRYLLVFVLILIFEILDLANDDLNLQTIPQQIGVRNTKTLGFLLILLFCVLDVYLQKNPIQYALIDCLIALITILFLAFATVNRSKYYSLFWAESIPIIWYLMIALL